MIRKNLAPVLLVTTVVLATGIAIALNRSSDAETPPAKDVHERQEPPAARELTIRSVEVRNERDQEGQGGVYAVFSDGSAATLALQVAPDDVEDIHDIVTYRSALVSPDARRVALQATGFEDDFVEIYDAATRTLHKRTYGKAVSWSEDGLLSVRACNLAGEQCTAKVSVSSEKPWLFETRRGVVIDGAALRASDGFVENIAKPERLSTFSRMLSLAGPDAIKGTGPFTVFAPTDEAFDQLPAGRVAYLLRPENRQELVRLIRRHVVAGTYNDLELEDGMRVRTVGTETLSLASDEFSYVRIDGAAYIMIPNIYASNGIVHVISGVL